MVYLLLHTNRIWQKTCEVFWYFEPQISYFLFASYDKNNNNNNCEALTVHSVSGIVRFQGQGNINMMSSTNVVARGPGCEAPKTFKAEFIIWYKG